MKYLFGLTLLIFISVAALAAQPPVASPTPPRAVETEELGGLKDAGLVKLNVTAWSKNKGFLKGLTHRNFEVFDGKNKLPVEFFKPADEPASIGILFDLSDSISLKEIPVAVDGLITFINASDPRNEYFIIAFARDSAVLLEPTQNKKEIEAALKILLAERLAGNTSVYDAMNKGLAKIAGGKFERKVLLVISDGEDNNSKNDYGDLRKLVRQNSNVRIYQIDVVTDPSEAASLEAMQAVGFFETLTENTGGRAFRVGNRGQALAAFETLTEELKNQYVIAFSPEPGRAEKKDWHEVRINLNLPKEENGVAGKVIVRAPKGFYF